MRIRSLFALLLLSALFLTSCQGGVRREHCEIGILLPRDFERYEGEDLFDAAFSNGEIIVGITRISHAAAVNDGIPATLDADKFAKIYMDRAGHTADISDYGDVPYYRIEVAPYAYYYTFYKSPYAYFTIVFIAGMGYNSEDILKLTNSVYLILD